MDVSVITIHELLWQKQANLYLCVITDKEDW